MRRCKEEFLCAVCVTDDAYQGDIRRHEETRAATQALTRLYGRLQTGLVNQPLRHARRDIMKQAGVGMAYRLDIVKRRLCGLFNAPDRLMVAKKVETICAASLQQHPRGAVDARRDLVSPSASGHAWIIINRLRDSHLQASRLDGAGSASGVDQPPFLT